MAPKTFILLFITFIIVIGLLLIFGAIKNWHKDVVPRKFLAKLIKEVIGEKGIKVFNLIVGGFFLLVGIFLINFMFLNSPSKKNGFAKKTEIITVQVEFQGYDGTPALGIMELENLNELKMNIDNYETYRKISFKNNYLDSLPSCLLDMKNLNELDIRNNKLTTDEIIFILNEIKGIKKIRVFGTNIWNNKTQLLNQFPDLEIDTSRKDERWY